MTTFRAKGYDARVWLNLRRQYRWMRDGHRSTDQMVVEIVRTIEHEYVHAALPEREERHEERLAMAFERAGQWARS